MNQVWSNIPGRGVVRCGRGCNKPHEHFVGTYEKALQYFGVDPTEVSGHKQLIDIVIFHQLSDRTVTKTSSELYYILMRACSEPQYWVPPQDRHHVVMDVLRSCRDKYLIKDDEILRSAREGRSNRRGLRRLHHQEKWEEMMRFR